MPAKSVLKIDVYYDPDKDDWIVSENQENLLAYTQMMIDAVNRKYYGIVDGYDGYYIGIINRQLGDKIAEVCPAVFDGGDFDHFSDDVIEEDSWNFQEFDAEDVWRLNMDPDLYDDRSLESFQHEVLQDDD